MTVDPVARMRVEVAAVILDHLAREFCILDDTSLPIQTDRSGRSCYGGPRVVYWDRSLVG